VKIQSRVIAVPDSRVVYFEIEEKDPDEESAVNRMIGLVGILQNES
jgi:hypothetical protein